jgi:hypothetical protein
MHALSLLMNSSLRAAVLVACILTLPTRPFWTSLMIFRHYLFSKLSQPIKGHLISHYGYLKSLLGADFNVLDTQQSEKEHQFVGKAAFNNSNRQYGAELKQMCTWVLAVEGVRY